MFKKLFAFVAVLAIVFISLGTIQAATITDFVTGNPVYEPKGKNEFFVISNRLDFGDIKTYATGGVTTDEVVQLLDVPAGTYIVAVGVINVTATGSGATVEGTPVATIGDGDDADGWITSYDVTTEDSGVSSSQEEGVAGVYHTTYGGRLYSSADTIDMTIGTFGGTHDTWSPDPESGLTTFVIDVWAVGFKPGTQKAYGTIK